MENVEVSGRSLVEKKKKSQQKNPKHMFQFTGQLISSPEAALISSLGMSINQCHKPSVRQYPAKQLPYEHHAQNPSMYIAKNLSVRFLTSLVSVLHKNSCHFCNE